MRLILSIMLDLGMGVDGSVHIGFWKDPAYIALAKDSKPLTEAMTMHPNFFWILTQFTWITTIIIIVFLCFRFFKYDQSSLPRWIKWIMTQRTLSLVTMYDIIVGIFFWAGMYKGFSDGFSDYLFTGQVINTVFVHAVIPVLMMIYSFIYLIRDRKASILKGLFIIKGMTYPTIYVAYYILIAVIWKDPYPITKLHENFTGYIWMAPIILFGLYAMLGFMITLHNSVLLRFNKKYDPKKDYEIQMRKRHKIEKLKVKARIKYAKNHEHDKWFK